MRPVHLIDCLACGRKVVAHTAAESRACIRKMRQDSGMRVEYVAEMSEAARMAPPYLTRVDAPRSDAEAIEQLIGRRSSFLHRHAQAIACTLVLVSACVLGALLFGGR